jgi:hypothetical protein
LLPGSILPESNDPDTEVIVCVTLSLLVQVTVVPIETSTIFGTKLKLLISICFSVGVAVVVAVVVAVGVAVGECVGVGVGVGVAVAVGECVDVAVGVGVSVAIAVDVAPGVGSEGLTVVVDVHPLINTNTTNNPIINVFFI